MAEVRRSFGRPVGIPSSTSSTSLSEPAVNDVHGETVVCFRQALCPYDIAVHVQATTAPLHRPQQHF